MSKYMIDIDKLKQQNEYTIKELCITQGWDSTNVKLTNNRGKAIQRSLNTVCKWHSEQRGRNKYIVIDSYYDVVRKRIDNRINNKGGNNGIFKDDAIENLILTMLSCHNDNKIILPKHQLYQEVELINDYYAYFKKHRSELAELSGVDKSVSDYYFSNIDRSLASVVETALNRLASRKLVDWNINRAKVVVHECDGKRVAIHYLCSTEERNNILSVERRLLEKYGCATSYHVLKLPRKQREAFYNEKQMILVNEYKMNYTYDYSCYQILFTPMDIKKQVEDDKFIVSQKARLQFREAMEKRFARRVGKAQQKPIEYQIYLSNLRFGGRGAMSKQREYEFNQDDKIVIQDKFIDNIAKLMRYTLDEIVIKEILSKLEPQVNIMEQEEYDKYFECHIDFLFNEYV